MNSSRVLVAILLACGIAAYFIIGSKSISIAMQKITKAPATDSAYTLKVPLSQIIDSLDVSSDSLTILINKRDYRLTVISSGNTLKTYPVVFGGNPVDDKLMEGDGCTPEGVFYLEDKYPHRSWNKFVWLNYPTGDSWKKHNNAKAAGQIPGDAQIGGEIGLHGVPANNDDLVDKRINWTLGCISMRNRDLDEVYPYITPSTPIVIKK